MQNKQQNKNVFGKWFAGLVYTVVVVPLAAQLREELKAEQVAQMIFDKLQLFENCMDILAKEVQRQSEKRK